MPLNKEISKHVISIDESERVFFQEFLHSKKINSSITEDNVLFLSSSFVGYIKTPNRKIILESKYAELNVSHILRMYYFTYGNFKDFDSPFFDIDESDNYEQVIPKFLNSLEHVLKRGLFQDYQDITIHSAYMNGKVNFASSYKNILLNKKEPFLLTRNILDTTNHLNQMLAYALKKISVDTRYKKQALRLLENFKGIQFKNFNPNLKFQFSILNKQFEYSYFLARIIVLENFLSSSGNQSGESLIINIDNLFEEFIRKVITMKLPRLNFLKWKFSHEYAFIEPTNEIKKYIPDLVFESDFINETATAVLDIKNKAYNLFKNADIYQICFYANLLNTDKAALIYPSFKETDSMTLEINRKIFSLDSIKGLFINLVAPTKQEFESSIDKFISDLNTFIYEK